MNINKLILHQGLRAVKQVKCKSLEEVEQWVSQQGLPVIVKPVDSAGSEAVTLCLSLAQVKTAFEAILGKVNNLGILNTVCFS